MRPAAPAPRQDPAQRWLLPLSIGLVVFALDQLAKRWAAAALGPEPRTHTISLGVDWLRLVYSQNSGVAFSLFQGMPTLFTITSIVITAGALIAYARYLPNRVPWVQVATGLLAGGAIGNIADRLRLRYVVDFISIGWWPVFNLADSAITVGVLMLAGYLIFIGDEPRRPAPAAPRDDSLLSDLLDQEPD